MRIYVINARKTLRYIVICALAVLIAAVMGLDSNGSLPVFNDEKDLPIYSVDHPEKKLALTFDCAWGAGDIPEILAVLKKENIKASFFLVGQWAEKYPEMVKQISAGGHDIANHGYSHLRMGVLGDSRIRSEISNCSEAINRISGQKSELFRPPYGDYSNNVVKAARDLGYHTIQWDVDSLDWKPGITQEEILSRIKRKVKPGSIILFHNDTPHTAGMLPVVISELKKSGFGFLPVSQMLIRENYIIDFEGRQKRK